VNEKKTEVENSEMEGERIGDPFICLRGLLVDCLGEIENRYDRKLQVIGIPTGYSDFDSYMGGLKKGRLTLIAGESGAGKTLLCQNIVRQVALAGNNRILFFSLESRPIDVAKCMLCSQAHVDVARWDTAYMQAEDWKRVQKAMPVLAGMASNCFFAPHSNVMSEDISATCRLFAEKGGEVIILDSLQLVGGPNPTSAPWETARALKVVARELDIPILVVSKLYTSRQERREERRPVMADLAGIEGYADEVLLINRTGKYLRGREEKRELVEITVTKRADGPLGTISLDFLPNYVRFEDALGQAQDYNVLGQ
jgi:replicative DNA helicase